MGYPFITHAPWTQVGLLFLTLNPLNFFPDKVKFTLSSRTALLYLISAGSNFSVCSFSASTANCAAPSTMAKALTAASSICAWSSEPASIGSPLEKIPSSSKSFKLLQPSLGLWQFANNIHYSGQRLPIC